MHRHSKDGSRQHRSCCSTADGATRIPTSWRMGRHAGDGQKTQRRMPSIFLSPLSKFWRGGTKPCWTAAHILDRLSLAQSKQSWKQTLLERKVAANGGVILQSAKETDRAGQSHAEAAFAIAAGQSHRSGFPDRRKTMPQGRPSLGARTSTGMGLCTDGAGHRQSRVSAPADAIRRASQGCREYDLSRFRARRRHLRQNAADSLSVFASSRSRALAFLRLRGLATSRTCELHIFALSRLRALASRARAPSPCNAGRAPSCSSRALATSRPPRATLVCHTRALSRAALMPRKCGCAAPPIVAPDRRAAGHPARDRPSRAPRRPSIALCAPPPAAPHPARRASRRDVVSLSLEIHRARLHASRARKRRRLPVHRGRMSWENWPRSCSASPGAR